ncbi:sugar phosphate isomerase/epimerase [Caldicoprobacter guelmensis]|uniref:sugar phosphate isomerase/epimerase family protein n=1 Tax=Caldicoprobacter guelmensis TaxID=1170224 RepID=UPI001A9C6EE0|nr:sugar phosphate isomerase/epimerase family protein [Caldicoprobacter guelmensis]MBM7583391.1 sugar phosphate isomerase/epimerase [Caldicoprobacter guelmensis]
MYNLDIGVIISLEKLLQNGVEELEELGLHSCQINAWNVDILTEENANRLKEIVGDKIKITSVWVGWPGPKVWNFIDGPLTLGLVPKEYRYIRMEALKRGADFASMLGVNDIVTHVGFIPENPSTSEYRETIIAVREVASYCKNLNIYFNFETGQETPITLVRTIEDVGLDNLGINLDPANLLLYGKANPIDAVDIFKDLVRGVHVKDGRYPTNGRQLGQETPVGEGMVNFPLLIEKLIKYNYKGPLIIEREISGPKQKEDILKAKNVLLEILNKY